MAHEGRLPRVRHRLLLRVQRRGSAGARLRALRGGPGRDPDGRWRRGGGALVTLPTVWRLLKIEHARMWRGAALEARKRRDCPNWGAIMRASEPRHWAEARRCLREARNPPRSW